MKTPAIVAHRGASAYAPENTLAAVEKAIEIGVDFIEVDVRITIDNIPIVIHDATLNRTTAGKGRVITLPYQKIKRYDAGSWFDPCFHEERVPSLNEVMRTALPHTKILIELKGSQIAQPLISRRLLELVDKFDAADKVIFQSFNATIIKSLAKENPLLTVNQLVNYANPKTAYFRDRLPKVGNIFRLHYHSALNPNHKWVTPDLVKKVHDEGKKIFCWTVDEPSKMKYLCELGVDGIITNKPDVLKKVISEMQQ